MIHCERTNSDSLDFQELVVELDRDLSIRDGDDHSFFAQFNKIDAIKYVVVAYENDSPVGCGAIKEYAEDTMEIKRMFVSSDKRGQGIATLILAELENWAKELHYKRCILETGEKQPEAVALYKKSQYVIIPNYAPYENTESSICFEKKLML